MDSFIFYRSFYEALSELPDQERLQLYDLICRYGLEMSETDAESPIVRALFALVKPQIDANYKRKLDGKKGGRPKAEPMDIKTKNSGYATEKPNVNANANVNANENVNVNANNYSEDFRKSLDAFKEMRKKKKSPLTERAEEMLIKRLHELGTTEEERIAILDQSTMNSWTGVYELKNKQVFNDLPTYDNSNNTNISDEEQKEILKLMGRA